MALPTEAELTGTTTTNAQMKTYLGGLRNFIANLFGTTETTAAARAALHVPLRGRIAGLVLSTAGSSSTFSVAAGEAADSTAAALMQLAASISKTTAAWAVGTGNGALDTGTIANSTWYHVHLIRRPDTGVVDVLISLSATGPTMPSGYTQRRRIGALRTNGSAQWTAFTQTGDLFEWSTVVDDVSLSTLGTTPTNYTLSVPTGIQVQARFYATFSNAAGWVAYLYRVGQTRSTLGQIARSGAGVAASSGIVQMLTNTSGQVTAESSVSSTTLQISTTGWVDSRGKDD